MSPAIRRRQPRLPTTPRFHRLREASRNPHTVMHEVLREHGDVARWRGLFDICLVNHPDFIRPVLTQDHRHFSKNTIHYRMLRQVMGNGLVTNDGPDWVRQRRLIQPAFASRRLARFDGTINALTASLLARWERQDPAEAVWIDREMSALTFDIVGETLFGRDIKEHAREMAEILEVVNLSSSDLRSFLTLYPWIPTVYNRRWKRAMKRLDGIVYGLMEARGAGGNGSDDLLGRLFAARDEETGEGMHDRQIRDEAVTLILAGHETSAMALSWTLYLLATHPEVETRLVEHLEAELHGAPAGTEDLPGSPISSRSCRRRCASIRRCGESCAGRKRRRKWGTTCCRRGPGSGSSPGRSTAIPSSGPTRSASTPTGSLRDGRTGGSSFPTCRLRRDPEPASGPAWRCSRSS